MRKDLGVVICVSKKQQPSLFPITMYDMNVKYVTHHVFTCFTPVKFCSLGGRQVEMEGGMVCLTGLSCWRAEIASKKGNLDFQTINDNLSQCIHLHF